MDIRFEFVGLADCETILGVWTRASHARRSTSTVAESLPTLIAGRMADPSAWFIVARSGKQTVGCAHGMPARENDGEGDVIPGMMHLSLVAVEPSHWRHGIGRKLTEKALEIAHDRGFTSVQLWTQRTNVAAITLYESLGFRQTGREKMDQGEPIIHFTRDISRTPT